MDNTGLYIDVGAANDGVTFGNLSPMQCIYRVKLKDLSVVGPANCCKNGLRFVRCMELQTENVNLYMGCTDYGASIEGTCFGDVDFYIGHNYGNLATGNGAVRVTDGIHITPAADGYGNNVLRLRVKGTIMRDGVVLSNTLDSTGQWVGSPIIISGSLEACSRYPVYAEQWNNGEIQDLYLLDLNHQLWFLPEELQEHQGHVGGCRQRRRHGLRPGELRERLHRELPGHVSQHRRRLPGHGPQEPGDRQALTDSAPDTVATGWIKQRSAPYQMMDSKAQDRTNLLPTLLARWRTTAPKAGTSTATPGPSAAPDFPTPRPMSPLFAPNLSPLPPWRSAIIRSALAR